MIALSTGTLNTYGLTRVFALAAEVGFDGVEVIVDARWDTRQAPYLRRVSAAHGLPIVVLHSPFLRGIAGWPHDALGRLKHTLALAQEAGVTLVVTHLPMRVHAFGGYWHGRAARSIALPVPWTFRDPYYFALADGRLQEMEAATGITIAVENMPSRRYLGMRVNPYWFNHLPELVRFPHLTLDTTHLGTWGMDPLAVWEQLKGHVVHMHLSNYADGKEHRPPHAGELPLATLLRQMSRDGYRGTISVEAGPEPFHAEDEAACRAELGTTLAFVKENFTTSPGS